MHPDRGILCIYRRSDVLSTILDNHNTLITNNSPWDPFHSNNTQWCSTLIAFASVTATRNSCAQSVQFFFSKYLQFILGNCYSCCGHQYDYVTCSNSKRDNVSKLIYLWHTKKIQLLNCQVITHLVQWLLYQFDTPSIFIYLWVNHIWLFPPPPLFL